MWGGVGGRSAGEVAGDVPEESRRSQKHVPEASWGCVLGLKIEPETVQEADVHRDHRFGWNFVEFGGIL